MQYTLHLTNECNCKCTYCGLHQNKETMSSENAFKAIDLALSDKQKATGIGFYGGEPLLCKNLIYDIVNYATSKIAGLDKKMFFKLTTNGLMLDDEFLEFAKINGILISLSLDGNKAAHDLNRKTHSGVGTYEKVATIIPKLLAHNRYTSTLMTITPNNVEFFHDLVKHIYSLGFVSIICSLDYSANWNDKSLYELKKQYQKLAELYYERTKAEDKFFLSPFESKINSHIQHKDYCSERCKLGYEQISVSPDGSLYPCVQFVGDSKYQIGHVTNGINQSKRKEIFKESQLEYSECQDCAIKSRCLHTCACINKYSTGSLNEPSPVLCYSERTLISIADRVAARLYKQRNGIFIHKHYNEFYSLVSLVEDSEITKNGAETQ